MARNIDNRTRSERINIRLSRQEKKFIQAASEATGLTTTELILRSVGEVSSVVSRIRQEREEKANEFLRKIQK